LTFISFILLLSKTALHLDIFFTSTSLSDVTFLYCFPI